ncbi:MAG TPA: radical SAM protein [Candidatus Riflebacteria bacterium]|jgi:uncharacterized radical SAM superfamily protein|nr:radical SAM protein [Candidatus Riflebacteria bacterium]
MQTLYAELVSALPAQLRNLAPDFSSFKAKTAYLDRIKPAKTLSVSLTDHECQQKCAHCHGHYLKGMQMLSQLRTDSLSNYEAVLISGGSSKTGSVPIVEHIDKILKLPERLQVNLHTGFQPVEPLLPLKSIKPIVSFDLPGSDAVIRDVFKLPYSVQDFRELFINYAKHFETVPHICIGLSRGQNSGEEGTIDFLAGLQLKQAVFIIFRPTPGTEFSDARPPEPARVTDVLKYAREKLSCELLLGCMRPAGQYRNHIDILAWLHGIRKIVQPDHGLLDKLKKHGITINEYANCCALNR